MAYNDKYTTEYFAEQKLFLLPELEKALKIAVDDLGRFGDVPVNISGVSTYTIKRLSALKVKTVAGLIPYTASEIISINGIGVKSIKEIIYLLTHGIKENHEHFVNLDISWASLKAFADQIVSIKLDGTTNLTTAEEDQIFFATKNLASAYDEFLGQVAKNSTNAKYIRTYKKFYSTLAPIVSTIAMEEKVSRQTVYSRLKRVDKIVSRTFGQGLNRNVKTVSNFFMSVKNAIKGIDAKKFFIAVTTNKVSLSPLVLECIKYAFGEKVLFAINDEKERVSLIISKIKKETKDSTAKILDKIVYQDNIYGTLDVFSTGETDGDLQKRFLSKLTKSSKILSITSKPNAFKFSKNGYTRTPDFYIKLENGKEALVVVMGEWFMTSPFNREYFKSVKEFCSQNHIGYLITDGRGNTFDEFTARELDEVATEKISSHISKYGKMNYKELKMVKEEHGLKTEDVIAYCIQNDCYAQYSPWLIKKIPKI